MILLSPADPYVPVTVLSALIALSVANRGRCSHRRWPVPRAMLYAWVAGASLLERHRTASADEEFLVRGGRDLDAAGAGM